MSDPVRHPSHYTDRVPGIECYQVIRYFPTLDGNAIKYIWRAGLKGDRIEDLRKSIQFLEFAIEFEEEKRDAGLIRTPGLILPTIADQLEGRG